MKTKNLFSIAALTICGLVCMNSVKAQIPSNSEAVTLNIKLEPIQTITVNPIQKTVDLVYQTIEDYRAGVTSGNENHFIICSTGGFQVQVKTDGNFIRNGSEDEIPAGNVKIIPVDGANNENNAILTSQVLGTEYKTIISATEGGFGLSYDITYDNILGASKYINKYKGDGETVYTAQVTYSIFPAG